MPRPRKVKAVLLPVEPTVKMLPGTVGEPPLVEAEVVPAPGTPRKGAEAFRAALAAKREEAVRACSLQVCPLDVTTIVAETVYEGKSIAEWSKAIEEASDAAHEQHRDTRQCVVLDLTSFPAWVTHLVKHWKARKCPSEYDVTATAIKKLIDKAEEQIKFASMDDENAKQLDEIGQKKKGKILNMDKAAEQAAKLRAAADKKRARAEELRAEAALLSKQYKETHK
jgi:hypothetical protein